MNYLRKFFLCIVLGLGQFTFGQQLQIEEPVRYLALGDSYTIGQSVDYVDRWPSQLYDSLGKLGHELDTLVYIATTGWRTDDLINGITKVAPDSNYNLVSLLIGVNNQYQGRSFAQYQLEFPVLLNKAIALAGNIESRVFVVSIPDYMFTSFGQSFSNPEQVSIALDQYNSYANKVCDSIGVRFFNITDISRQGILDPELVASDGLHPSGKQYSKWVELLIGNTLVGFEKDLLLIEPTVYPNPSKGIIKLKGRYDYFHEAAIYDITGKRILTSYKSQEIDISSLNEGVYIIRLTYENNESYSYKLVKE